MTEFPLGVAPFWGRHDPINFKAWTQRFVHCFGLQDSDICFWTSDSGLNVKQALLKLCLRWIPCAAHTVHFAVKASLGATGKTAAVTAARWSGPPSPLAARAPSRNPAATNLLTQGRKIANELHHLLASVGMMSSVPLSGIKEPLKRLTESPGRWDSTYLALV